jgi:uncharacterized SAM-binding protein YcdF (DUF218 family)
MLIGQEIPAADLRIMWVATAFFAAIFLISFFIDSRRFGNIFLFFFFTLSLLFSLGMTLAGFISLVLYAIVLIVGPVAIFIFFIANTVTVTRREGVRLSTLLPALLDVLALCAIFATPLATALKAPAVVISLTSLMSICAFWFFFSFGAMVLYSVFYCAIPHHHHYDAIIIHGAGLNGTKLTPLLKGRADKAIRVWQKQGSIALFVCSGGQGPDEVISEAEALHRYLISRGVPDSLIITEDQSTTTFENLQFSQRLLDQHFGAVKLPDAASASGRSKKKRSAARLYYRSYQCVLVTSDYHVLRASEYARKLGLKADGIGSHTRSYYWPTAIIREFIALTREHKGPYIFFAVCWALIMVVGIAQNSLSVLL